MRYKILRYYNKNSKYLLKKHGGIKEKEFAKLLTGETERKATLSYVILV